MARKDAPALEVPPLIDYITQISPAFRPPFHMAEWLAIFDRIRQGETVRGLLEYPIRHFKTETTLHGVLWLLEHDPTLRILILTYSHKRAVWLGKRLRVLARRTNVGPARGHDTIEQWENDQGGGVNVMSADMSSEGFDVHLLFVDDPLDEIGAKSEEKRDAVDEAISNYTARCMRGGKPGSVIISASRWLLDDPTGRRLGRFADPPWERLHKSAIIDLGKPSERAFAEDVWPLAELLKVRAEKREEDPNESWFWARLQNEPRDMANSQFREPERYDFCPVDGVTSVVGLDMSWSGSKHSDKTAIVVVTRHGGVQYIRDVVSMTFDFEAVESALRNLAEKYGARIFSYMSGPEKAIAAWGAMRQIRIIPMHAGSPKFVRGRSTVDRWNAGLVRLPTVTFFPSGMRVESFINLAKRWTGNEGEKDDEIDALVSASDALLQSALPAPRTIGKRRMG